MTTNILILNGPNLNMLGTREPDIYGAETLADIEKSCQKVGKDLGLDVECRQSNTEGELVDWIQKAGAAGFAGIIINAGAYTHTSVALLDALLACNVPVIEVHLSNIFQREEFRHHSYISKAARGVICGFGGQGYTLSLEGMAGLLRASQ
jgi:3-dehydroquinate dehydratase-2